MLQSIFNTIKLEKFMIKWEYASLVITAKRAVFVCRGVAEDVGVSSDIGFVVGYLCNIGSLGWELVGFDMGINSCYYFKRPLSED